MQGEGLGVFCGCGCGEGRPPCGVPGRCHVPSGRAVVVTARASRAAWSMVSAIPWREAAADLRCHGDRVTGAQVGSDLAGQCQEAEGLGESGAGGVVEVGPGLH